MKRVPLSRAVDRITAILSALAAQPQPSTLSDIAGITGLDKSTLYRFLQACERNQLVRRDSDHLRYTIGYRIIEWSGQAIDAIDVARLSIPILNRLNEETGETVALYMREGTVRTAVVVRNSPRTTVVRRRLGSTAPLVLGAAGKAILGFLDEQQANGILDADRELEGRMREQLRAEVAEIRLQGFARSMRELSDHAWSVAAPVFGPKGEPIASLGISAPGHRHSEEIETRFAVLVVQAAEELTRLNGGSRPDGVAAATTGVAQRSE